MRLIPRRRRFAAFAAAAALAAAALAIVIPLVSGATFTVCAVGCDFTSITAAIAGVASGDTISVNVAGGSYSEAGPITVNKTVTIQSSNANPASVTITATGANRGFNITATGVTLRDLTVTSDNTANVPAVDVQAATAQLSNVRVNANSAATAVNVAAAGASLTDIVVSQTGTGIGINVAATSSATIAKTTAATITAGGKALNVDPAATSVSVTGATLTATGTEIAVDLGGGAATLSSTTISVTNSAGSAALNIQAGVTALTTSSLTITSAAAADVVEIAASGRTLTGANITTTNTGSYKALDVNAAASGVTLSGVTITYAGSGTALEANGPNLAFSGTNTITASNTGGASKAIDVISTATGVNLSGVTASHSGSGTAVDLQAASPTLGTMSITSSGRALNVRAAATPLSASGLTVSTSAAATNAVDVAAPSATISGSISTTGTGSYNAIDIASTATGVTLNNLTVTYAGSSAAVDINGATLTFTGTNTVTSSNTGAGAKAIDVVATGATLAGLTVSHSGTGTAVDLQAATPTIQSSTITSAGLGLNIRSAASGVSTSALTINATGASAAVAIDGADGAIVKNLTINKSGSGHGVDIDASNATLRNSTITVTGGGKGVAVTDSPANGSAGIQIVGNTITTASDSAIEVCGQPQSCNAATNLLVLSNSITVSSGVAAVEAEQVTPSHSNWLVSNNTITSSGSTRVLDFADVKQLTIQSNTLTGPSSTENTLVSAKLSNLSDITISGNKFVNSLANQLTIDASTGRTVTTVTVTENFFNSWDTSAIFIGRSGDTVNASVSGAVIQRNAFLDGNVARALNNSSPATVSATNNWWGSTGGPQGGGSANVVTQPAGAVTFSPYLVGRLTASPTTFGTIGGSSSLTYELGYNSSGQTVSLTALPSISVQFATGLGTMSPTSANTSGAGIASSVLTSGTAGAATVTATLPPYGATDLQRSTIVTVTAIVPTPTAGAAGTSTPGGPTPTGSPTVTGTPGAGTPTTTPSTTPAAAGAGTAAAAETRIPRRTAAPTVGPGTPTVTGSPTPTGTPAAAGTPAATGTPAAAGSPTPSGTPGPTPTPTPARSPTAAGTPTRTPTPTVTPTPTITPTPTPPTITAPLSAVADTKVGLGGIQVDVGRARPDQQLEVALNFLETKFPEIPPALRNGEVGRPVQLAAEATYPDGKTIVVGNLTPPANPRLLGERVVGPAVEVLLTDTQNNQPVERPNEPALITLPFKPELLTPGTQASDMFIAWLDAPAGNWVPLRACFVDGEAKSVTCSSDRVGTVFAAFADTAQWRDLDGNNRYFAASNTYLRDAFLRYFEATGGVERHGIPRTNAGAENRRQVQWFQRSRLEAGADGSIRMAAVGQEYVRQAGLTWPPETAARCDAKNSPTPLVGTLGQEDELGSVVGLVGDEFLRSVLMRIADRPLPGVTPHRFIPGSSYCVDKGILDAYDRSGGQADLGLPISPEVQDVRLNRTVQYFQNGRLEYDPAAGQRAVLGQVGDDLLRLQGRLR